MHRSLLIPEILCSILDHCTLPGEPRRCCKADLAALARTCRAFKEPALDALWKELFDLSPLVRCLPEASHEAHSIVTRYTFHRSLDEAEWNTLRNYTRRVRSIHGFASVFGFLGSGALREVFALTPFAGPLFPNLRSLSLQDFTTIPVAHVAVKSLTLLSFDLKLVSLDPATAMECLGAFGECCPSIQIIHILRPPSLPGAALSRLLCRWTNLRLVICEGLVLSMGAILHLSSLPTLTRLSFTLSADLDHSGPVLHFYNLVFLEIKSGSLKSVAGFFSRILLLVIEDLSVCFPSDVSKQEVQEYKTAVKKACLFNTLTHFKFYSLDDDNEVGAHHRPQLTLDDFLYRSFSELRVVHINLGWSVGLTDPDLLDLASTWPHIESLIINDESGWGTGDSPSHGGITLGGLVRLLRCCPTLRRISLAIDTQTFTHIPDGLDVSFPPRQPFYLNFLDSRIELYFVPGLVSTFEALGLDPHSITAGIEGAWDFEVVDAVWSTVTEMMYVDRDG